MATDNLKIRTPKTLEEYDELRLLFHEYANSLSIDLCFQNFYAELANLPGEYAPPRGALLTVYSGDILAGCCAFRPLDAVDYPNACEMKRLYVTPSFRGKGIGRLLALSVLDAARLASYDHVLLDTLTEMEAARALYEELGFVEIAPYYFNPLEGAHYLMAKL
jgi:ribosomal protein S18 acetylase RimI-like enzyme